MIIFCFLGVGPPCCSILCQFWLCEEAQCVYLRRHLGSPHNVLSTCMILCWTVYTAIQSCVRLTGLQVGHPCLVPSVFPCQEAYFFLPSLFHFSISFKLPVIFLPRCSFIREANRIQSISTPKALGSHSSASENNGFLHSGCSTPWFALDGR